MTKGKVHSFRGQTRNPDPHLQKTCSQHAFAVLHCAMSDNQRNMLEPPCLLELWAFH